MVDSLSISASIVGIAAACLQTARFLNRLRTIYTESDAIISGLCTECTIMSASLTWIQSLILRTPQGSHDQLESLHATFDLALTGCMITMSVLDHELKGLMPGDGGEVTWASKTKLMWKDDRMKNLLTQLRGQQSGLALLIQLLSIDSLSKIEQALKENAAALQEIKHQTKSLRSSHPDVSTPESILDVELDIRTIIGDDKRMSFHDTTSLIGPSVFDFDDQVVNSHVYRKTLVTIQMRQKAAGSLGLDPTRNSSTRLDTSPNIPKNRDQSTDYHGEDATSKPGKFMLQEREKAKSLITAIRALLTTRDYTSLSEIWLSKPSALSLISPEHRSLPLDLSTMQSGGSLLHSAARSSDEPLIQHLLLHGANPFVRDRRARLPQEVTKDRHIRAILTQSAALKVALRCMEDRVMNSTPAAREYRGYLMKREGYGGVYKLRWCVLEGGVLNYYAWEAETGSIRLGALDLRTASVTLDMTEKTSIYVTTNNEEVRWQLRASHSTEGRCWYTALVNAIAFSKDQAQKEISGFSS